jgi:hypothetical protein
MDNVIKFPKNKESADEISKRLLEDLTYTVLKMISNEGFDINDRKFRRDMGSWMKFMKIAIDRQLGATNASLERIKRVSVDLDE